MRRRSIQPRNQKPKNHIGLFLQGARSTNITTVNASLRCMCMLLDAHPAFNYASDLLQLVVANMAHRQLDLATMCCAAVQGLLGADVLGQLSLEAVQLVADLIKKRNCVALRPMVLTSLFALQIDSLQGPVGMGTWRRVCSQLAVFGIRIRSLCNQISTIYNCDVWVSFVGHGPTRPHHRRSSVCETQHVSSFEAPHHLLLLCLGMPSRVLLLCMGMPFRVVVRACICSYHRVVASREAAAEEEGQAQG